jgi:hypothetical protein
MENHFRDPPVKPVQPNTTRPDPTDSPEDRAISLYQEIMGVGRSTAEYAYMLVDAHLNADRDRSP